MNNSDLGDDDKLTPAQARIVARVRWLMLISGFATVLGIAVVVTIVGYRVFRTEGRGGPAPGHSSGPPSGPVEATSRLPQGARVVSIQTAGDRIVVIIDMGGSPEVRTFDAKTLNLEGRLHFAEEP
jgi:hypothetical protein